MFDVLHCDKYSVRVLFYLFGYRNKLISRSFRDPPQCEQGHQPSVILRSVGSLLSMSLDSLPFPFSSWYATHVEGN
jgi:hypothetical protein